MKSTDISQVIHLLKGWYFEGKPFLEVTLKLGDAHALIALMLTENGYMERDGTRSADFEFQDVVNAILLFISLRKLHDKQFQ